MSSSEHESNSSLRRNRRFIASAMEAPMLSAEHEASLARRWRELGDETALHEMVTAYLRLVIAVAARFRHYGLPMSDLVQEGNVGLMQAAARFEPDREVRFSTYATWWIRSAIQEHILRNWSIVRTGTSASQKALFFNLRWLRAKLDKGGAGTLNESSSRQIAESLKVSPAEVRMMAERLSGRDQSLNAPIGEDGADQWEDFLADPSPSPEEVVLDRRDGEIRGRWLRAALAELTPREQLILDARRLREDRATLEELGQHLGITKERVRQIEHKAFEKLQAAVLRHSQVPGALALA